MCQVKVGKNFLHVKSAKELKKKKMEMGNYDEG